MNAIMLNTCEPTLDYVPHLRRSANEGETRFLVQFGGQGNAFLPELSRLYAENELLRPFFAMCFDALRDVQARADVREAYGVCFPHGFELRDWLRDRNVPPEEALFECPISFPGNTINQLALLYLISRCGYPLEELGRPTIAATGHSQGILAATIFALTAGNARDGAASSDSFLQVCYDWLVWFSMAGVYIKRDYRAPALPQADSDFSIATDDRLPTPMAVVFGPSTEQMRAWIEAYRTESPESTAAVAENPIAIALINSPTVNVLAGHPIDLCNFRRKYLKDFINFDYDWEYLPVTAPFHSGPHLRPISRQFASDSAYTSLNYRAEDIRIPLVSFVDGEVIPGGSSLVDCLAEILFHGQLDWCRTLSSIQQMAAAPTHILDFGPGRTSATLTRKFFERETAGEQEQPNSMEIIQLNRASGIKRFLE